MPMHEYDNGLNDCVTHQHGLLRDRILDRLDCESDRDPSGGFSGAALTNIKSLLFLVFAMAAALAAIGVFSLIGQNWIFGCAAIIGAMVVAGVATSYFRNACSELDLAIRHHLGYEASYWKYARLLANSERELAELGFPIMHRGVWIMGCKDKNSDKISSFVVRAIIKLDSDSVPIDYLPFPLVEVKSYSEAIEVIDKMHKNDELLEVDGRMMAG